MAGWGQKGNQTTLGKKAIEPLKQFADIFKPSIELEITDGLKIGGYGRSKKGKTRFGASIPCDETHPKIVIDTESNFKKEMKHWPIVAQQNTYVAEVLKFAIDPEAQVPKIDLVQSLEAAMEAMDIMTRRIIDFEAQGIRGSIIIDSASDFWIWLDLWLQQQEDLVRAKSSGTMLRTEWGKANKRYTEFIYMLLTSNWHVFMSFRSFPAVSNKGENLGYDEPKWQKTTPFWLDMQIEFTDNGQERFIVFRGDRLGDLKGQIANTGWVDLLKYVQTKSGITIKEIPIVTPVVKEPIVEEQK